MGSPETHACFRLKSKRRRIRLRKQDQEKHLLRLHREENKLRRQIRDLGYEPLIPPVQKGYKRIFVLRDDVQRSQQAAFFAGLLAKINTVQYSDTKAFTKKQRQRGRKIQVPLEQKLQSPNAWEWRQKGFTEAEAACFYPVPEWRHGRFYTVYQFREPWRFVLRVVPNLVTEVKVKDNLLEQRLDEIESYLSFNDRRERQSWLLGKYVKYRWFKRERAKYQSPYRNRPFHAMLEAWQ
jgi:hypothetical protein